MANMPGVNMANMPGVNMVNIPGVNMVNMPGVNMANTPDVNMTNMPGVNMANMPGIALQESQKTQNKYSICFTTEHLYFYNPLVGGKTPVGIRLPPPPTKTVFFTVF